NLLDNAVKFSADGGIVEVRLADGELAVRDHGPGIPEQDLLHVFERFYRSDAARATAGSGLGLAIVKQVAESHGGPVTSANAADGGAVVRLRIPTVVDPRTSNHDQVRWEPAVHDAGDASPSERTGPAAGSDRSRR